MTYKKRCLKILNHYEPNKIKMKYLPENKKNPNDK